MMKPALIALAAALGLVFALAETGFAQDRPTVSTPGKLKSGKVKRSLPMRAAPPAAPAPETQGGTLDGDKDNIIYF